MKANEHCGLQQQLNAALKEQSCMLWL